MGSVVIALVAFLTGATGVCFAQAPQVLSTSPSQNELDVPVNANIAVVFDVDMDESTINSSTFVVNGRSTGLLDGALTYDEVTSTATFDPLENFKEGDVVTVVLTTGIESWDGYPLPAPHSWSFTGTVDGGTDDYEQHADYPADDGPWSIFAADFDDDGDLDLATANAYSDNSSILLNDGDGSFASAANYVVGEEPWSVTAADVDADGDIDLATANLSSNDVSVLKNNGNGTFAAQTAYPVVGEGTLSIASSDLDGDGDLDLVTADMIGGTVTVLRNNGNGTFGSQSTYSAGETPVSVYAADLDGDADFDITTANYNYNNITVLLNNGDGTFATFTPYPAGNLPLSVIAADVDADGDLDLAASNCYSQDISILMNEGSGSFADALAYAAGECPWSVKAADLDNDGDLDLVASNEFSSDVSVLLNNGDGTFASPIDFPTGLEPYSVFAADLTGDGAIDLATANHGSDNVSILINISNVYYQYLPGDANMHVGLWPPQAIGADITYIVNYLRNNPLNVPCLLGGVWASGDVNGSCAVDGSDVIRFVNYLRGVIGLTWCPGYDPAWPTPQDVPAEQPVGWPGCESSAGHNHQEIRGDCLGQLGALSDSGYMVLEVIGNDLHIHHLDAFYNCCLEYFVEYTIVDYNITAVEQDLGQPCYCECYFDLESILYDLEDGLYTVQLIGINGGTVGIDTVTVGGGR